MHETGDIPPREEIKPRTDARLSDEARAKVKVLQEIKDAGGVVHAYLQSVNHVPDGEAEDEHLQGYKTHCFPTIGWVYYHGEDEDHWIPGDDLGMLERHYD